jgi:carbon storage regulator
MMVLHKEKGMLVLSRKMSERILIGDEISITIVRIGPNSVRIGVEAPRNMSVVRSELCPLGSVQEEVAADDCVPQR